MPTDPLAGLRDIHLPDPVAWWPPAPGWWLLAGFILLALGGLGWRLYRRHRRLAFKRQALRELRTTPDIAALSSLLRRVALAVHPRAEVAGLSGEAWLAFLDRSGQTSAFTQGAGRRLADAPYRVAPLPAEQWDAVRALATVWIQQQ